MATEMLNFRKKMLKNLFSEVIRGMKLKLCINVCVNILYINFIAVSHVVFVGMATLSFHRFIMGTVKVSLYFYLTLGILSNVR